jgi:hypothetical protein
MAIRDALVIQRSAALAAAPLAALLGLGLLAVANISYADPPAPPTAAAPQVTASPQVTAPPQLTKRARKQLERQVKEFVTKVTGSSDEAVQLWRTPICPVLAGLPEEQGDPVFAHLERTLRGLGVPVGQIGCQPNFQVVITSQPGTAIDAMAKGQNLFGEARAFQSFLNTARPVRIWYGAQIASPAAHVPMTAIAAGAPGQGPVGTNIGNNTGGAPAVYVDPTALRFQYNDYRPLAGVVAVIDLNRVVGFGWDQIADYVAMAGLTRVNLDAKLGDDPTILRLFSATAQDRPAGLSDWDKALLTELYRTDPAMKSQRFEVAQRMVHDIAP